LLLGVREEREGGWIGRGPRRRPTQHLDAELVDNRCAAAHLEPEQSSLARLDCETIGAEPEDRIISSHGGGSIPSASRAANAYTSPFPGVRTTTHALSRCAMIGYCRYPSDVDEEEPDQRCWCGGMLRLRAERGGPSGGRHDGPRSCGPTAGVERSAVRARG